jgi:divalent metal cation (Fe/Co/Zn/Cd) transporter
MTFSDEIQKVDTCRVYHSGPNYFVEVDIVLPPEMPLWRAHDIAQDLQDQIEALPDVDRCFIHVDHEVEHKPASLVCSREDLLLISVGAPQEGLIGPNQLEGR